MSKLTLYLVIYELVCFILHGYLIDAGPLRAVQAKNLLFE